MGAVLDSTRMTNLSVVQRFRAAHVRGLKRTRPKSSVEQWHSQQQRRRGGAGRRSGRRRVTFDGAAVGQLTASQHYARVCGHPPGLSHCRRQELLALDPQKTPMVSLPEAEVSPIHGAKTACTVLRGV